MNLCSPKMLVATGCLLLTVFSAGRSFGTNRYYSDLKAESANGLYRLEAKSPDNADSSGRMPFQAEFVYTFTDAKTGKQLWTRKQPEGKPVVLSSPGEKPFVFRTWLEGSPVSLFVRDDGWSVLWLSGDDLVAVDASGKKTGNLGIIEAFSKEDKERYVHLTSAGYSWGLWHEYFASDQKKPYFVVRTWWGRRVVFDLVRGRLAPDTEELHKHLEQTERAYVRKTLQAATKNRDRWAKCCGGESSVLIAILMAGQMQMKECTESLRALEDVPSVGSWTMGMFLKQELKEGDLDVGSWGPLTVRRAVQLSLRRLGEVP